MRSRFDDDRRMFDDGPALFVHALDAMVATAVAIVIASPVPAIVGEGGGRNADGGDCEVLGRGNRQNAIAVTAC